MNFYVSWNLMEQQIIDIAIKHWNRNFSGISASDIAEKLNLSHNEVMECLEKLKEGNKGTLNQNVSLGLVSINIDEETEEVKTEHSTIVTHIYFPSKEILENYYSKNLNVFINNGEYKNRLHRGFSQIDLVYFEVNILDRYLRNREIYSIDDDVTGGLLKLNINYLDTLTDEEIENKYFNKIWYGKRRLLSGHISVSAILHDLSEMPVKEQSYWYGFEIENPKFSENDNDFSRFVTRAYYGELVDSNDPIFEISKEIKGINKIFGFDLFLNYENTYLTYPINNTLKEFADCNSELYKLIGPDNLKYKSIKKVYLDYLKGKLDDIIHSESNRAFSQIQILTLIIEKLDKELAIEFKEVWETIKSNRIIADHKISKPNYLPANYIDSFRLNCDRVRNILKRIGIEMTKKNGV